jgi:hypothetical protein
MGGRKGGNSVSYSLAASCFRISRFFCVRFASALRFALLGALFHFLIFFLFCVFEAIVSSPLENRVKLLPATQPIVKRQVQYGKGDRRPIIPSSSCCATDRVQCRLQARHSAIRRRAPWEWRAISGDGDPMEVPGLQGQAEGRSSQEI